MNRDRKNYLAHTLEGGLFMGGMSFLAADTVLTVMAQQLGAPNWLISLLPTSMFIGLIMAPIFTASFIERSRYMKRIVLFTGVPQRLVILIAGVIIILYGDEHPQIALAALALAPILSGLSGGIGHGAWVQVVARTVPTNRRSSLTANRNLIAAAIALVAGFIIKWLLDRYDGSLGFGLLHLIAFAFLVFSYISFLFVEEKVVEPVNVQPKRSFKAYLRDLVDILRVDRNFRNFAIMRLMGPSSNFLMPFVAIYAIRVLGANEGFAGDALVAATIGQVLGNVGAGYLGDRIGGKVLLVVARVLFITSFLIAAFAESYAAFMAYFFIASMTKYINIIGNITLMLEIAPDHRRPTYGALAGILNGPSMIIFALVGSYFWTAYDSMKLQAVFATVGILISLYFISRVKDPRSESPS
ncbi:MFS transporter [Cerasicoccus frondis]|uniref:MFS transporter n=1 Tax=Cerasicoccus frondis TaxID=490090 RepID=UPI002852B380|nr:MFS transporter [Cerasicoccus frondis]